MRLAIFDLDHTLLMADSDFLWGQFLCQQGVVDAEAYAQENLRFYQDYQAGTLDIAAFCAFSFKPLTEHPRARLDAWRAAFVTHQIEPVIAPGAQPLIAQHKAATDPEEIDGRFTGRISGVPNFQQGKVIRLAQWREDHPQTFEHVTFYSDSRNDLPLLEAADLAVAIDPDPVLKLEAEQRGWPIRSLRGG